MAKRNRDRGRRPPPPTADPRRVAYLRLRGIAGERVIHVGPMRVFNPSRAIAIFGLHAGGWCVAAFDGEHHWREVHRSSDAAIVAYCRLRDQLDDELPQTG